MIEKNKNDYDEILDSTTEKIENFIKKTTEENSIQ